MSQDGQAQFLDGLEELPDQRDALLSGAMFVEKQFRQPLFEAVDLTQDRELIEVRLQFQSLFGFEVLLMASHQRQQTAVLGAGRVDLSPAGPGNGG